MNWNQTKSVTLSWVCVIFFGLLLAVLDVSAYWMTRYYLVQSGFLSGGQYLHLLILLYLCSVAGWIVLWNLWRFLERMRNSQVFVQENVAGMQAVGWCCFAVGIICALGAVAVFPLLLLVAISAGELASRVGITPANLSILKNNKAKAIRFSTLMELCHELSCQPGDLLEFRDDG